MIRPCKFCGKTVDFDETWCDHETMEESAWLDIRERMCAAAVDKTIEDLVHQAAKDLGLSEQTA